MKPRHATSPNRLAMQIMHWLTKCQSVKVIMVHSQFFTIFGSIFSIQFSIESFEKIWNSINRTVFKYHIIASTVAGIATVDSNGRIQVVNKPITNTISNISFKCDVCGLMFSHLTLLNHHKRIHTQDGTDTTNDQQITVVTQQGQGLVQGNNLVNENGQNLAQIQIVATEAMDQQVQQADHSSHHHHSQQVIIQLLRIHVQIFIRGFFLLIFAAASPATASPAAS